MLRKLILLVGLFSFSICNANEIAISNQLDIALDLISSKKYDSAFQIAKEAHSTAKNINYSWGVANSLYIQGWSKYKQKENSEALLLFLESLRILQDQIPNYERTEARAGLHMNIGKIYNGYSNFEGALKFYDQGLEIAEEYGLIELKVKFIYNQGVVYKHSGDLTSATEKFIESKFLSYDNKIDLWYFNSINQLGLINHELERYDSARAYFDAAFPIAKTLKRKDRYQAMIHHNLANSYFAEKNYKLAEEYYLSSVKQLPRFISYNDLAELYLKQNRYEECVAIGEKAIEYYKENSSKNAMIFKTLAMANLKLNKVNEGALLMERYTDEINLYLERRKYTKKLEDAYQIDLLTKQYFLKLEQQKRQAQIIQLSWFFGIVVFAFILLFFAQRWYQKRKKADATDAIKAIFNQSEILRGSLDREL